MHNGSSAMVFINLFGTPRIWIDGNSPVAFRSSKAIEVIAYLALANKPIARSEIAAALWPELDQERQLHNLRQNLTYVRQALPDTLQSDQSKLYLTGCSVLECEGRGALLEGFDGKWIQPLRERFLHARVDRLNEEAESILETDPAGAELRAREAITIDPILERPRKTLLRALVAQKQTARAVREFREYAARLDDELNVSPSTELGAIVGLAGAEEDTLSPGELRLSLAPSQYLDFAFSYSRHLYYRGNFLRSRIVLEEALSPVSSLSNDARSIGLARLQRIAFDLGDVVRARTAAEEAVQLACGPFARAHAHLALARVQYAERDYDHCEENVRKALRHAKACGDLEVHADTIILGSVLRWFQHSTKEALRLSRKAEVLAAAAASPYILMVAMTVVASSLFKLGLEEEAALKVNEAIQIGRSHNFRLRTADALSLLGRIRFAQNRLADARTFYREALSHLEGTDGLVFLTHALIYMGELEMKLDHPNDAVEYFRRGSGYWRVLGNKVGLATTYRNIGKALYQIGNYEEAMRYLQDALSIWASCDEEYGQATCNVPLAQLYATMGERDEAIKCLRSARETLAKLMPGEIGDNYEDPMLQVGQIDLLLKELRAGRG